MAIAMAMAMATAIAMASAIANEMAMDLALNFSWGKEMREGKEQKDKRGEGKDIRGREWRGGVNEGGIRT